ncbi:MAG: S26 family signal peptidase, partial [Muribaculaceae bacterium]|nr:S26 family signal peptidase [Muribaculaceae bacterium]
IILEWETGKAITFDWDKDSAYADGSPLESHTFTHGYCFMAGDNVSDSNDSRYWGLVPEEYIVGVVTRISYSIDPHTGQYRKDRFMKKTI